MDMVIICLIAGGFAGGFVNGLAGFGTALFALGWFLQVLPPREASAVAPRQRRAKSHSPG